MGSVVREKSQRGWDLGGNSKGRNSYPPASRIIDSTIGNGAEKKERNNLSLKVGIKL